MTGIPEDFDQTKNKTVTQASRASAEERKLEIEAFIKQLKDNEEKGIYAQLGVKISTACQKVEAKLIPSPKIMLGDNRSVASGR